jgi:hypothetical protein
MATSGLDICGRARRKEIGSKEIPTILPDTRAIAMSYERRAAELGETGFHGIKQAADILVISPQINVPHE